jgi:hypothetical protein
MLIDSAAMMTSEPEPRILQSQYHISAEIGGGNKCHSPILKASRGLGHKDNLEDKGQDILGETIHTRYHHSQHSSPQD